MTRVNCVYPDGRIENDAYVFDSMMDCEYGMITLWMLLNNLASSVNNESIRARCALNIVHSQRGTLQFEQGDLVYITYSPAINKVIAECVRLAKKTHKGPKSDYPYWHQIECDLQRSSMTLSEICSYRDHLKAKPSFSDDDDVWDKWDEEERFYCNRFGILRDISIELPNMITTAWPGVYNLDILNH